MDRFNNRDRGMNNRGGRFGGRFNRSFSRSPKRSPNRNISPDNRRNKERDGRWTEEDSVGKPDLEMDEILKKARKEDMVDRSKDVVKKPGW